MVRRNPGSELVAVCDICRKKTENENIREILLPRGRDVESHPEVDVVSVCTPNGLHAAHALGWEACGIEKPMVLHRQDCEQGVYKALQIETGFCVMQNRYSPPSVWFRNWLIKNYR